MLHEARRDSQPWQEEKGLWKSRSMDSNYFALAVVPRSLGWFLVGFGKSEVRGRKLVGGRSQGTPPSPFLLGWRQGLNVFWSPASTRLACFQVPASARWPQVVTSNKSTSSFCPSSLLVGINCMVLLICELLHCFPRGFQASYLISITNSLHYNSSSFLVSQLDPG